MQKVPSRSGIGMAAWNWKVVHQVVSERFSINLSRGSCLNYLHRLGFVVKRPKKHLVKTDQGERESFVVTYAAFVSEARRSGRRFSSLTRRTSGPMRNSGATG